MNASRRIVWLEVAGFAILVALSWADELVGFTARIFGKAHQADLQEAIIETIMIIAVGVPIVIWTKRMASRLFYLESFPRVCAWCQKVERHGHWMPIAQFFSEGFQTRTTHGICPTCKEKERTEIHRNKSRKQESRKRISASRTDETAKAPSDRTLTE